VGFAQPPRHVIRKLVFDTSFLEQVACRRAARAR